jgi:2-methylcitrate dehydratase PrpD
VALKVYPCCYALQRPIAAVAALGVPAAEVVGIRCQTPACSLQPLIHHRPRTGLEGKFSLEYGIAAAILDHPVAMASFTDECVRRPEAQRLAAAVRIETTPGGSGLLEGAFTVEIRRRDGTAVGASLDLPPGAPGRPPLRSELNAKLRDCCGELAGQVSQAGWAEAAGLLSGALN